MDNKWFNFWINKDKVEIIKAYYESVNYGIDLYNRIEKAIKFLEDELLPNDVLTLNGEEFVLYAILRGEKVYEEKEN